MKHTIHSTESEMTKEEFDTRMAEGLSDAKEDRSSPVDEVMGRLISEVENSSCDR